MKNNYYKTILSLILCITIISGAGSIANASKLTTVSTNIPITSSDYDSLKTSYEKLTSYAQEKNIPLNLTFDTFVDEYKNTGYSNVDEYTNAYYNMLKAVTNKNNNTISLKSSLGNPFDWQYNTGTSLPKKANYSKYNLLEVCQPGDVIYEANGGFGITGHIAIVEGKFYDEKMGQYYIRVIEANQHGVCRGVLDDDRIDRQKDHILRVSSATDENKKNAVEFCKSQLGKSYILDFAKHTSVDTKRWYCSELVWASYKREGIDIETQSWFPNEPGVSPRDVYNSDKLVEINVK